MEIALDPVFYIGIFNIIAALLSWKRNEDVVWATIAFFLGGLYVLYWVLSE